jgi:hypothetical protein
MRPGRSATDGGCMRSRQPWVSGNRAGSLLAFGFPCKLSELTTHSACASAASAWGTQNVMSMAW